MIFLRHPITDAPADLCYGRLDVGWGDDARAQVDAAVAVLSPVTHIWTSPLSRCRDLARIIADRDRAHLTVDDRLQEYDFGAWEGRLWSDIPRAESEPWTADILNAAPPGGERFSDLVERVREVLSVLPRDAMVVTHAGPIRAARMILTGASFDEVFAWKVPFCHPVAFDLLSA